MQVESAGREAPPIGARQPREHVFPLGVVRTNVPDP